MDLSKLSDDEVKALYEQHQKSVAPPDPKSLSDDELMSRYQAAQPSLAQRATTAVKDVAKWAVENSKFKRSIGDVNWLQAAKDLLENKTIAPGAQELSVNAPGKLPFLGEFPGGNPALNFVEAHAAPAAALTSVGAIARRGAELAKDLIPEAVGYAFDKGAEKVLGKNNPIAHVGKSIGGGISGVLIGKKFFGGEH